VRDKLAFEQLRAYAIEAHKYLDEGETAKMLRSAVEFVNNKLHVQRLREAIDANSFDHLDELFRAKLAAFLNAKLEAAKLGPQIALLRGTIKVLLDKQQEFYGAARKALTRNYEFSLTQTYQATTTDTALFDLSFDFAQPGVGALLANAVDGDYDAVLLNNQPGVLLNAAALTHNVERHSHVEVTLPYFKYTSDHFNNSLAKITVRDDDGRVLAYEMEATDEVLSGVSAKWQRDSSLTVGARLSNQVCVHSGRSLTYDYSFKQAVRGMRSEHLLYQIKPYITAYFGHLFNSGQPTAPSGTVDDWITDSDVAMDQIENNGRGNFGNTLLSLRLSVPGEVGLKWLDAKSDRRDLGYMNLSRRLQAKLKELIPFYYFQNAANYQELKAALPLLVYAAIPPSTGAQLRDGQVIFNVDKDLYWDWREPELREAIVRSPSTARNLTAAMQRAFERLAVTPGMKSTAEFYRANDINYAHAMTAALTGEQLQSLLFVEATLVGEAVGAGLKLAEFKAAQKPSAAVAALTTFGQRVTEAFNEKVTSLYGGGALRPLGTMLFIEAAQALAGTNNAIQPDALLQLSVLKKDVPLPPANSPDFEHPKAEDLLMQQMLTNL